MSNLKIKQYIQTSLTGSGFVIVDSRVANDVMPEYWPTLGAASSDFQHERHTIERLCSRANHLVCSIGNREIEVYAMCKKTLAIRIEYLTGMPVTDIRGFDKKSPEETPAAEPINKKTAIKHEGNFARNQRMTKERKEAQAVDAKQRQERLQHEQAKALKQAEEKRRIAWEARLAKGSNDG